MIKVAFYKDGMLTECKLYDTLTAVRTNLLVIGLLPTEDENVWKHPYADREAIIDPDHISYTDELWHNNSSQGRHSTQCLRVG